MNHRHVFTLSLLSGVMATSLAFSIPPKEDNRAASSSQVVVPVLDAHSSVKNKAAQPAATGEVDFVVPMEQWDALGARVDQNQSTASEALNAHNPVPEAFRRFKLPASKKIEDIVKTDIFEGNYLLANSDINGFIAGNLAEQTLDRDTLKNRLNVWVLMRLNTMYLKVVSSSRPLLGIEEKYLQDMASSWMAKILLASTPIDVSSQATSSHGSSSNAVAPQGAPSRDKDRDLLDISNIDDYLPRCGELLHCLPSFLSETPLKAGQIYRLALQQFLEASVSAKLKELIEDGEESDEDDRKDIESQKPKFYKLIQILLDDLPVLDRTKLPEGSDASEA